MKVTYAAFFSENRNEEGEITGYTVRVPDVHECTGEGKTLLEAVLTTRELAIQIIQVDLKKGKPLPFESKPEELIPNEGETKSAVFLDIYHKTSIYRNQPLTRRQALSILIGTMIDLLQNDHVELGKILMQETIDLMHERMENGEEDIPIYYNYNYL